MTGGERFEETQLKYYKKNKKYLLFSCPSLAAQH